MLNNFTSSPFFEAITNFIYRCGTAMELIFKNDPYIVMYVDRKTLQNHMELSNSFGITMDTYQLDLPVAKQVIINTGEAFAGYGQEMVREELLEELTDSQPH